MHWSMALINTHVFHIRIRLVPQKQYASFFCCHPLHGLRRMRFTRSLQRDHLCTSTYIFVNVHDVNTKGWFSLETKPYTKSPSNLRPLADIKVSL